MSYNKVCIYVNVIAFIPYSLPSLTLGLVKCLSVIELLSKIFF